MNMKKSVSFFVSIICLLCISCGNATKQTGDNVESDSINTKPAEEIAVYKISKLIVPKSSSKIAKIYQSPSKTAKTLTYYEDDEEAAADFVGGHYDWSDGKTKGDYYQALPVIEKMDDWYKVYITTPKYEDYNYQFIGYVPSDEWKEATIENVTEKDVKNNFMGSLEGYNKADDYYVEWGYSDFGDYIFVIGTIVDGKAFETDLISYYYEKNLITYLGINPYVFTDTKEITDPKGLSSTFKSYKEADFKKILSVIGEEFPNICIKIKGDWMLYKMPANDNIEGHKIILDF